MPSPDAGILVLLGALLGAKMLVFAHQVRVRRETETAESMSTMLAVSGTLIICLCVVTFVAMLRFALADRALGKLETLDLVALLLASCYLTLIAFAGVLEIYISRIVLSSGDAADRRLERSLALLTVVGWAVVCIFASAASLVIVPLGMMILFLVVAIAAILRARRKSQQANFLWLMAFAVEQQVSIADELTDVSERLWGESHFRCKELASLLRAGLPINECLQQVDGLVSRADAAAIHLAAESNTLAETLRELAIKRTRELQESSQRHNFGYLLVYFWFVTSVVVSVVSYQMYFIIPKFELIFRDFGTDLPDLTKLLIKTVHYIGEHFVLFLPLLSLPAVAFLISGLIYFKGREEVNVDWITYLFPRMDMPGLLRNLSRVVRSRLPLTDGIDQIVGTHHRRPSRNRLERVVRAANGGEDCWEALCQEGLINRRELAVIYSAERVDNLPWALTALADGEERRQSRRITALAELMRPIFVVGVGIVVFFIAVAYFVPLIKLLNDLS